jgi:hypothetical protein
MKNKYLMRTILSLFSLTFTTITIAQSNVVVIPLFDDDIHPLENIISVATKNGDFDNPATAMASITDASESNPYLVVIAPGVYELAAGQQLIMQEYVDVTGSGQNSTIINGTVSASSAIGSALVIGANNATIRDLTVENVDGVDLLSTGLFNDGTSPTVVDTKIVLSGANIQIGIYCISSSSPAIIDSTISILSASDTQYGFFNNQSSPTLKGSTITVSGGSDDQYGFANFAASITTVQNSSIAISSGSANQYGISNTDQSRSTMTGSTVSVSAGGGLEQYGVYNLNNGAVTIVQGSKITAPIYSVYDVVGSGAYESYISGSILNGPVEGDPKCSFTFTPGGVELADDCDDPT